MSETTVVTPADALRKSFNEPRGWSRWPIVVSPADGFLVMIKAEQNGSREDIDIRLHVRGDMLALHGAPHTSSFGIVFVKGEYRSFEVPHATDFVDFARQLRAHNPHPIFAGLADLLEKVGRGEDLRMMQYSDE